MKRIYVDLDHTLIAPVFRDPEKEDIVTDILVRPLADWFLKELAKHGEVWILSAAGRDHVENALSRFGDAATPIKGIISDEDLEEVRRRMEEARSYKNIEPIAPPGFIFDDFPSDSDMFYLKGGATGIPRKMWIQVDKFVAGEPDQGGLEQALLEYRRRTGN